MDHLKLLCDFAELNWVFTESSSIEMFLQKLVDMIALHMEAEVCSIYLYDEQKAELFMKANQGLQTSAVDSIRLKMGEGLTGLALQQGTPLCTDQASRHPGYKHFGGIDEEQFEAFLAVPIMRGITRIGILTLQRQQQHPFSHDEVAATQAVTSQLANIIENARLLSTMADSHSLDFGDKKVELKLIRGKVAAEGFAQGGISILQHHQDLHNVVFHGTPLYTLDDFQRCVSETENQLETIQAEVEEQLSDVASLIFTSHLLMLKDRKFIGSIERLIQEGMNPPQAILQRAQHYMDLFRSRDNLYIQEKADDVRDLALRLIRTLVNHQHEMGNLRQRIIIADELYPSDILKVAHEAVSGIILVGGGVTSHIAFLARSLKLPLVIAEEPRLLKLPEETIVLLDAETGNIHLNPTPEIIKPFQEREKSRQVERMAAQSPKTATLTRDGTPLTFLANINLLSDMVTARDMGAAGIGLYRSEIPFLIRSNFPSEEEQFVVYQKLAAGMPGKPLTIRTLDIGGDKVLSYYHNVKEENPFLGMRSIRFSLHHKHIFSQQIRAILRAGSDADLQIMFPMISSLDEFREARQVVTDCIEQLAGTMTTCQTQPKIGMMVEIPSVIDLMDELAVEVDFFSIGTNDLVQYLLAADRTNEKVAPFYLPHHPAVLRAINKIVKAAQRQKKPVSICGDMANHSLYLPFFLGIGLRTFSLDPAFIGKIGQASAAISLTDAQLCADQLLQLGTVRAVEEHLHASPCFSARSF
ncbi:MAG: phosphoenolpyruvate--protein phosphotransferase [Deltaproteobacteria bacterium]|nr:phosphoenolpyruvate--protein phosphotransferase [Candidatus Anaeroferrophillus wilburensis]MBN2887734.1 phosphoenolpyruvate--protein phosphotransferase [Deltaproteobacteria bacterium]